MAAVIDAGDEVLTAVFAWLYFVTSWLTSAVASAVSAAGLMVVVWLFAVIMLLTVFVTPAMAVFKSAVAVVGSAR